MSKLSKISLIVISLTAVVVVLGLLLFLGGESKVVVENEAIEYEAWNMEQNIIEEEVSEEQEEKMDDQDVEAGDEQNELEKEEQEEEDEKPASDESSGEAKEDKELKIKNNLVIWGHTKSSGRTIDTIIVHSSYNALGGDEYDKDLLIKEYKEYGVSPHYLIDRKGKIYRLVDDKNVAWHAGVSKVPDEREGVNNFSIGIELINNKEDKYTKEQYNSLNDLIDYLKGKYKIKYILGHDEVSPGRKTDPWNMDWKKVDR